MYFLVSSPTQRIRGRKKSFVRVNSKVELAYSYYIRFRRKHNLFEKNTSTKQRRKFVIISGFERFKSVIKSKTEEILDLKILIHT